MQKKSLEQLLAEVDSLKQELDALKPLSGEMALELKKYYRVSLAYSYNAIEGNTLDLNETKKVPEQMAMLIESLNAEPSVHPILHIADVHGEFERIHPFVDGNGRVGRLLASLMSLRLHGNPDSSRTEARLPLCFTSFFREGKQVPFENFFFR